MNVQVRRIDASTMPLMSLAATAIDQPQHRDIVIETMLQYIATDPVICRVEPGVLADKQNEIFNPVLVWVKKQVGATLTPTHSIFAGELSEENQRAFRTYLQGRNITNWDSVCVIGAMKSSFN